MNNLTFLAFALAIGMANSSMVNLSHNSQETNTTTYDVAPYYDIENQLQEDVVMHKWINVFTNAFDKEMNGYLNQQRVMFNRLNFLFEYESFSSCELNVTFSGTLNNRTLEHTFHDDLPSCGVQQTHNYTVYLNASLTVERHNSTLHVCDFIQKTSQCSETAVTQCVLDMNYDINMSESTLFDEHGHLEIPLPKCPPSESPKNLELVLEVNMSMMPTK